MAQSSSWSRWSLVYLISYLGGGGLGLVVDPDLALGLLGSNGAYGEVLPRLLGMMMIALGSIVAQIVRHGIDTLYPTAVVVRIALCVGLVGLYALSADPLFLTLLGIVGLGVVLTVVGLWRDRTSSIPVEA